MNNAINFKAKSFISERDTSSIAFEVKRTRATWDPSLAIPGTERRGGWRCPPGTTYGGEITDRFGRNCGWGVARRLANSITDLGERLENIGDRRRGRRAARAAERVSRPGLVERAAGRVADVLDTAETVDAPKAPRARRGGAVPDARRPRQARPNLRSSEKRRMNREIDNPGAPRTGEGDAVPPIGRPRPAAPRARRRNASADVVERKPKPVVDAPAPDAPAVEPVKVPTKKAPAKKVAAKKKAVKKKAPAKKAAARRVTPAAGGDAVPPRMSTQPPVEAAPQPPRVVSVANLPNGNFLTEDLSAAPARIDAMAGEDFADAEASIRALREMRDAIELQPLAVFEFRDGQQISAADLSRNVTAAMGAWERQAVRRQEWLSNQRAQEANAARLRRPPAPPTPPRAATPAAVAKPPLNGLRDIFAGRSRGYERNFVTERRRILDLNHNFDGMAESAVMSQMSEFQTNLDWNREYLRNLESLDPNREIQMPNRIVKAGDLKEEVKGVVDAWEAAQALGNARLNEINANRLPGLAGQRLMNGQVSDGFPTIEAARTNMDRLVGSNPGTRFALVEHNNKFYVVSTDQLTRAKLNGLAAPTIRERKGGLPLADELPPIDTEVAREAKSRVDAQIIKRQRILSDYLNKRYGEGNAPWKEMTPERLQELALAARRGDREAKTALSDWAKEMYSHAEIEGMNGKTYRTIATIGSNDGRSIGISVQIQRQAPDGTWVGVGSSSRNISLDNPPTLYNSTMFINKAADKNSGIQTIYNQHAFMYAKAAGFKQVGVSAVQDGPYVWGKVGFREQIQTRQIANMNNELIKFRSGQPSLIREESDARIIEHLIAEFVRDETKPRHMDFIVAISNRERSATEKKAREKEIKDWFLGNMAFSHGKFDLEENDIMADPRERR